MKTQDTGQNYLLETMCIADTGADICCASDEMRTKFIRTSSLTFLTKPKNKLIAQLWKRREMEQN